METQLFNPQEITYLEQLLLQLTLPDNEKIQESTRILKKLFQDPKSVNHLLLLLEHSQNPAVRQLAAVYLPKRLSTHWRKIIKPKKNSNQHIGRQMIEHIKQTLLQRLIHEPIRVVRHCIAGCISSFSKRILLDKWPELIDFILNLVQQSSNTNSYELSEVALLLLCELIDHSGHLLRKRFSDIQQYSLICLTNHNNISVRIASLRVLASLLQFLDTPEEMKQFRSTIVPMIQLVESCLNTGDTESAIIAFEVFDMLAESPSSVFTRDFIPPLIRFMLNVASAQQLELPLRERATTFVSLLITTQPQRLSGSERLLEEILICGRGLVSEFEESGEDTLDSSEPSSVKVGVDLLDNLSRNIPQNTLFPVAYRLLLESLNNPNPNFRKGGMLMLATLAENCDEVMKNVLQQLLEKVCMSLDDPEVIVRQAAYITLTQFSDHLMDDVIAHHHVLLPRLFVTLGRNDESPIVKRKALVTLETFCQKMGDEIQPYIQPIMNHLGAALMENKSIQITAIKAIGAVASAAGEHFLPYFPRLADMMRQIILQKTDEHLELRARATECIGSVALAVGRETFQPFLQDFFNLVVDGMSLDHCELRETSFSFFQSIAEMIKGDFAVFLDTLLPFILSSLDSDDGMELQPSLLTSLLPKPESSNRNASFSSRTSEPRTSPSEDFDSSGQDDSDNDDWRRCNLSIRSGHLDEKASAAFALASIIEHTGAAFLPFLETSIQSLKRLSDYPHPDVRQPVFSAFLNIATLMHTVFPPASPLAPGKMVDVAPNALKVIDLIISIYFESLYLEDDKETASISFDCIVEICKLYGLIVLNNRLEDLTIIIVMYLQEKALCQKAGCDDENNNEQDEQYIRHDYRLLDSVTDLLLIIAQICGPMLFTPVFQNISPALLKFIQTNRPPVHRELAIGCFAEIGQEVGGALYGPILNQLFKATIHGCIQSNQIQLQRNSAYCIGVLFQQCPQCSFSYCENVFRVLKPLCCLHPPHKSDLEGVQDNAISALVKMMVFCNESYIRPDIIRICMNALPFNNDLIEAQLVYPTLIEICNTTTHSHLFTEKDKILLMEYYKGLQQQNT